MAHRRFFRLAILVPSLFALGCAAPIDSADPDGEDESVGEAEQAAGGPSNRGLISTNGLTPGILATPALLDAMRLLALAKLSSNGIHLVATPLTNTAEGRTLLDYVIRCALPANTALKDTTGVYRWGSINLAGSWVGASIDAKAQRWVSACLLAHANYSAQHVTVLLGGNHPSLDAAAGTSFGIQEASFYGNVFNYNSADPPSANNKLACVGWESQALCNDPQVSTDLTKRVCGNSPDCGFGVAGDCWGRAESKDACTGYPTKYGTCYSTTAPRGSTRPGGYEEVITVYLHTTDYFAQHPGCTDGCGHSPCSTGPSMGAGCNTCVTSICAVDPYCCTTAWDAICVGEVGSVCGASCSL